jgi:hypothetical protein
MENFDDKVMAGSPFIGNNEIKQYLIETSKWGKFVGIVGYVGMGLLILFAFVMMFGLSVLSQLSGAGFPMGLLGFVYIIIAGVYYFPITYLYKFSVQIKQGLDSNDTTTITSGFQNLKSLFKFMGIFPIVVLSLYGLILLIAIPTALLLSQRF